MAALSGGHFFVKYFGAQPHTIVSICSCCFRLRFASALLRMAFLSHHAAFQQHIFYQQRKQVFK
jgi:hypothetical protein